MKTIEKILNPVDGYLGSITRNTVDGWYEIEVGIPSGWIYDENKKIDCEILAEDDEYKLIKISPKNRDIVVDDLINFLEIIIITNNKIAEKQKEFKVVMEEMKGVLEKKANKFLEELDTIKVKSFNDSNLKFVQNLDKPKKTRKPRTPKPAVVKTPIIEKKDDLLELDGKITKSRPTTSVTEETTVIDSPKT